MTGSRPLRFLAAVLTLWVGARLWLLWPESTWRGLPLYPAMADRRADGIVTTHRADIASRPEVSAHGPSLIDAAFRPTLAYPDPAPRPAALPPDRNALLAEARGGSALLAMLSLAGFNAGTAPETADGSGPRTHLPRLRRLSAYGWVFVRGGNGTASLAGVGQLGGSQSGVRLDYALTDRLALTGRMAMPLRSAEGREAAIGFSWKPVPAAPLTVTLERRMALGRGGRNAFAAMIAGGANDVALPADFRLDAYGQVGIVGLKRADGFIEGGVTAMRTVSEDKGARLAVGAGAWGAAQPGVTRLDIGPRLRFRFDTGGAGIGASLDWRQRVAGDAAPQSGLALTLDGSF